MRCPGGSKVFVKQCDAVQRTANGLAAQAKAHSFQTISFLKRRISVLSVDEQELDAEDLREGAQLLGSDSLQYTVVCAAGEDPGFSGDGEVRQRLPDDTRDRQQAAPSAA